MINSYKEDEKIKKVAGAKTVLRLLSFLLTYRIQVAVVLFLIALGTGVSLLNPLFMELGIDRYISSGNVNGFIKLLVIALSVNVIKTIAVKIRMVMMANITNQVIAEIRDKLFCHIQTLDLGFFDARPGGKILSRVIGDVNALKDVIENSVTNLIPNFVTVVSVVIIMLTRNWRMALFCLSGVPLLAFGLVLIAVKAHKFWQMKSRKNSNLTAFVNEDLSGIKVVQGFAAENETQSTMNYLTDEDRKYFIKAVTWADGNFSVIDLSWGICIFFLYFGSIKILGPENISVGVIVAFTSYIEMFWQPIMNLSQFYNQLITAISKAERIFEILDTDCMIKDSDCAEKLENVTGNVEFRNVTFAYHGVNPVTGEFIKTSRNILEHTDFSVKAGETIALVGPTGAGKTTIVNLICRFYDIQEGEILIDGKNIRNVTQESLRGCMGIMNQDTYIFSGTIRENILYGRPDATENEMLEASKAVHAHDFIEELKDGYDTVLTSRGGELSAGQRQLIAFARTMISNPKILILDEATSSIDTRSEKLVQQGIAGLLKGRTSFVIAHRLSTIQDASRIFVVDKGRILESGTPVELMEKKGLYYKMVSALKTS